jgi:hypothetical protein
VSGVQGDGEEEGRSTVSKIYETSCTITIAGNEQDVKVRAHVACGWDVGAPNGFGACVDGEISVLLNGGWVPLDSIEIDDGDEDRATDALEETCLEDDSDYCGDADDYGRAAE